MDAASLLTAAERGDNEKLTELLAQSVSPEVHNASHFTPLILSAYAGRIKILLSRGANVNAASLSGNNAIMMAAQNGKTDAVEYLSGIMNVGVNTIRNKTGDTPLMFASKNGHLQTVKSLLKLGAKEDAVNSSGMTAISNYIFCAASEGHVDVAKELITSSSSKQLLQAQDMNGNTPLHFASYGGHVKTVELLLEHGASPFIKNRYDKTPLMDITDALSKITDAPELIENVNTCRSFLVQKCKELEEISQKNMDDLTKFAPPETSKKSSAKPKPKHKKTKNASQQDSSTQDNSAKDSGAKDGAARGDSGIKDSGTKESETKEGGPKDSGAKDSSTKDSGIMDNSVKDSGANDNGTKAKNETLHKSPPTEELQTKTLPQDIKAKLLIGESHTKSHPVNIPSNYQTTITGKSPTTGKSPMELYSTILKTPSPSTGTSLVNLKPTTMDGKTKTKPPSTNISNPPGFPPLKTYSPTNTPTNHAIKADIVSLPPQTISSNSHSKTTPATSTTDLALLDQALSCINTLDTTQSSGHALEVAYRDFSDMCTAMATIHPNAVALDLPVKSILGLGLNELSMEQLGVLEEVHHKMLQSILDTKLAVVRSQERMRLEEQKELEIALLTNKLRNFE